MISRRSSGNQEFCTVESFFFDPSSVNQQKRDFDDIVFLHNNFAFIVNEYQKFAINLEERFKEIDCDIRLVTEQCNPNSGSQIYLYSGVCNNPKRIEYGCRTPVHSSLNMDCCGAYVYENNIRSNYEDAFELIIVTKPKIKEEILKNGGLHVTGNLYVFSNELEQEEEDDDY